MAGLSKTKYAVHVKTQDLTEGWYVVEAFHAQGAIQFAIDEHAPIDGREPQDDLTDELSLHVDATAYKVGRW